MQEQLARIHPPAHFSTGAMPINSSALVSITVDGQVTEIAWGDLVAQVTAHSAPTDSVDLFWLVFGGILVFMMMLGLALLEIGCVGTKNTKHIMFRILGDCCITGLTYYTLGYGFAFMGGNGFIGSAGFFMSGEDFIQATDDKLFRGHHYADWFFQWAVASVAVNICSGAIAERVSLAAYFCYTFVASLFIFPVCAHWIWSETGWASAFNAHNPLFQVGAMDFAGTGALHMFAGISALVGCILVGPRLGRFGPNAVPLPKQSVLFQFMGVMLLWFGWYGFNCVSTLSLEGTKADAMAKVAVNLTLSASTGGIVTVLLTYWSHKVWDIEAGNNGVLAGCVAVTGCCPVIEPAVAIALGAIGSVVYVSVAKLVAKLEIDDAVDAVPVHFGCGLLGKIAPGFVASPTGVKMFYGSDSCGVFYGCSAGGKQLGAQLVYALAIFAFVAATVAAVFIAVRQFGALRVSAEAEKMGLDAYEHGGPAYDHDGDGTNSTTDGLNGDDFLHVKTPSQV
ncbi:hypothetical protein H310_08266 [Aphanomyces invadans]|uniref:Ammonium transporter AmtB-like domain-containing protein n=1 Tax=Aphanomyces invadans TaxID=157072 RepID=A0A024TZL1_9STRA|nr:hypothetical protein H310_08266 [Aphanomyces invadans]ETV99615.1 hypothetical protein H310_08266 [Aphanomyces invadans]|eukprot:XP_008872171.1 hypothetical protein H310_08266 [Aphanomyces invadans]